MKTINSAIGSNLVMGLDVSTKTIGIALFNDLGKEGKLKMLHHVTPKIKPLPENKTQVLFEKVRVFEEFLKKYIDIGIDRVIIEEPLLRSNNVRTVEVLLRFNGMISRSVYEILGVVPEFISSYDARKFGFPDLMEIRKTKRNGQAYTEKEISKKNPVLFGGYPYNIDKKEVILEKVSDIEPQITWIYDKKKKLAKESFDMADSYTCVRGYMRKEGFWL